MFGDYGLTVWLEHGERTVIASVFRRQCHRYWVDHCAYSRCEPSAVTWWEKSEVIFQDVEQVYGYYYYTTNFYYMNNKCIYIYLCTLETFVSVSRLLKSEVSLFFRVPRGCEVRCRWHGEAPLALSSHNVPIFHSRRFFSCRFKAAVYV